jgi:6-phosphogluconolactonase
MSVAAGQLEIVVLNDATALAENAADRIVHAAQAAISERGRFTLALSGGSTPGRLYRLLAQPEWKSRIDWLRTWLFFGDDRCVPYADDRSNYYLANETLLKPAQIDATHVLPIPVAGTPAQNAAAYEATLRKFFTGHDLLPLGSGFPQFDVILLGLGDDGHTASLFPGKPTLDETKGWVTWSPPGVLPPPVDRVTFTFPVLNAARAAMFFVSGAGKAEMVHEVLDDPPDRHKHPSSGVQPTNGKLIWLLDASAASLLNRKRGANTTANSSS